MARLSLAGLILAACAVPVTPASEAPPAHHDRPRRVSEPLVAAAPEGPRRPHERAPRAAESPAVQGRAASRLPPGIGCWVTRASRDEPLVASDVFGWYVTDVNTLDEFSAPGGRPLFMSFASHETERIVAKVEQHRARVIGAVWDLEGKGRAPETAERMLRTVGGKAHELGLLFGVTTFAGPMNTAGVDYAKAHTYADFMMPMLYIQWHQSRRKLEALVAAERAVTKVPIIALMALTSTRKARTMTPEEIVSVYRGLPVDGFAVWNPRGLTEAHVAALRRLAKP